MCGEWIHDGGLCRGCWHTLTVTPEVRDPNVPKWQATFDGETHELRDDPYRNDTDDLVVPLADGTDVVCKGAYPTAITFGDLEVSCSDTVEITMLGSQSKYQPGMLAE